MTETERIKMSVGHKQIANVSV